MSNLNLPAKQIGTVLDLFESPNVQSQIQRALPEFLTVDKLTRITITVMRQNPGLVKCSQQSLLACFFACAQLGLTPEPWLGLCYFVPFWSTKLNCMESTFIPGYRGLIELMRRAGSVIDVDGKAVYQNEPFEVEFGLEPKLRHSIADGDPGEFRGAYCKFLHSATDISFDYMSKWEVDKIMARTKSRNKKKEIVGPWVTDYPAMAIKTVIRRHSKYKSKSVEDQSYQKAMHAETVADQLGPESQRQLFLPDAGPVEPVYSAADF
ncbi:MAG: hypothetical protein GY850_45845, partial [bacterium]|nr:hypothetical protein [bacterium]